MAPPNFNIKVSLIHEESENSIENQIKMIKDEKLPYYEKRIIVLVSSKTTENKNEISLFKESFVQNYINNISYSYESNINSNSTCDNSKSLGISQYRENILPEKKLNSVRANFCLKNKLYDIILNPNLSFPEKYKIDENHFVFVYQKEFITYGFTQSGLVTNENVKINTILMNIDDSKYYYLLGLFFCDKEIEIKIGNEIHKNKCKPNEFICKKCLEINKKYYNIKNKYLINIHGRVAKMNKGNFHCFGHYLIGNQIEQCISKFSCKACKLLDLYSKYYFSKKD